MLNKFVIKLNSDAKLIIPRNTIRLRRNKKSELVTKKVRFITFELPYSIIPLVITEYNTKQIVLIKEQNPDRVYFENINFEQCKLKK